MDGEAKLRRCILGGNALFVGVVTAIVAAFVYVPAAGRVADSDYFQIGSFVGGIVSVVLLLLAVYVFKSHTFQRFVYVFVGLAMTALLIVAAGYTSSKSVVIVSLVAAAVLTGVAALIGANSRSVSYLYPALVGLGVLFTIGMVMLFFLRAHWFEVSISTVGVALFTALSVYNANEFVKKRRCTHNCCEEGVFSLFLNFVNVASNLIDINSSQVA